MKVILHEPAYKTVGQLIERLKMLPPEMPIKIMGADSVGWVHVIDGVAVIDHFDFDYEITYS